jgi:hypothetical protein
MIAFTVTERLNRGGTVAAAYYGLREQGLGQEEALTQAKKIADTAHAVYGKENLPSWARGSGWAGQIARSAYMYKTYAHNYLQILAEFGMEKEWKALAWLLVSPAVLAGSVASPLMSAVFGAAGIGSPDDPEEQMYDWLKTEVGAPAERVARYGVLGLGGFNLKGSMSMNLTDIPTSIGDILGAPASMVKDVGESATSLAKGDVVKSAEKIAPRFVAGPIRAYREKTEGVTTKSNQPVFFGADRVRADWYGAALRSLGFNPARTAAMAEKQWHEKLSEKEYTEARSEIYSQVRRYFLQEPRKRTKADWTEIMEQINEYNARLERGKNQAIPKITGRALKTLVTKMEKPARKELLRAGEEVKETKATMAANEDLEAEELE